MYVQLMRRQRNVQRAVKSIWLPCHLDQMVLPDGTIHEMMLINLLPEGWLPAKPAEILISVAHARGSTGLKRLRLFRPWARHFDCYILELWRGEPSYGPV